MTSFFSGDNGSRYEHLFFTGMPISNLDGKELLTAASSALPCVSKETSNSETSQRFITYMVIELLRLSLNPAAKPNLLLHLTLSLKMRTWDRPFLMFSKFLLKSG
eukprot:NODE_327_length_9598_cov_1.179914.p8 type:complete len:105 gc:universal NODE_327_length_9598_cov_1.179914:7060-7374(+)